MQFEAVSRIARRIALSVACSSALVPAPLRLMAQIEVGAAAHVSAPIPHAAHTEALIVAHPTQMNRLGACTMVIDPSRNRLSSALYLSEDAGTTWRLAVHDTVSRHGEAWDPACAFAPDGSVLFATLPDQRDPRVPDLRAATRVYRSPDGGRTWGAPVAAPKLDNEYLAVDWTSGPHRGRVYVVGILWTASVPGGRHLGLLHSSDGGRTFVGPARRLPEPGTWQGGVGAPRVAANGTLLVPMTVRRDPSQPPAEKERTPDDVIAVMRILDGGSKFESPVTVAAYKPCDDDAGPPVLAIDRSSVPFRNRAYIVYPDGTHGRCHVMLSWSDDGTQWSPPIAVDDPPVPLEPETGPDAFLPQVAVNDSGVVGISWYDRREGGHSRAFRQRFTASADGGSSVLASVAVSRHPYRYAERGEPEALFPLAARFADTTGVTWLAATTGRSHRVYYMVGDYGGLATRADGAFQPVWVDNRSGIPQLYTAPIHVSIRPRRAEERDRDLGHEVSRSVTVLATRIAFDAPSCTVDLGLVLTNVSQRALVLPLTVRAELMLSQLGAPVALDSRADDLGRPLWEVGRAGQLAPGTSLSHGTRIRLEDCKNLEGRGEFSYRTPVDARLQATPAARITGPKVLALKLRVFEKR